MDEDKALEKIGFETFHIVPAQTFSPAEHRLILAPFDRRRWKRMVRKFGKMLKKERGMRVLSLRSGGE